MLSVLDVLMQVLDSIGRLALARSGDLMFSAVAVAIGYALYKLLVAQIDSLYEHHRMGVHVSYTLKRLLQWVIALFLTVLILRRFGVTVESAAGLLTLFGGTVVGFASINTLGNAIAGVIIMVSRPFRVGDRIYFDGQFVDVTGV